MLAYCLHTIAYRETSAVVELFTREFGRIAAVAKGAKRHGSALRNVLMQFQPIDVSVSGKSELRTLTQAQWVGGHEAPQGPALIIGFYFNELLVRMLPRDDPHPGLFDAYQRALADLAAPATVAVSPLQGLAVAEPLREADRVADPVAVRFDESLRRFEWSLLRETGYAPDLGIDAQGQKIEASGWYRWHPDGGFFRRPAQDGPAHSGPWFSGEVLLALGGARPRSLAEPGPRQQAKQLTRAVLGHCLDGQIIKTRQLLVDLHRI